MSSTASTAMASLQLVSLEQIQVPDGNPRRRFDERALRELADSIGKHGVTSRSSSAPPTRATR
jgi:hypothetical protein